MFLGQNSVFWTINFQFAPREFARTIKKRVKDHFKKLGVVKNSNGNRCNCNLIVIYIPKPKPVESKRCSVDFHAILLDCTWCCFLLVPSGGNDY